MGVLGQPRGRDLYCSPSCEWVTGYTAQRFQAQPDLLWRVIHEEDLAQYAIRHQDQRKAFRPDELKFRVVRRDGTLGWIAHVCQPVCGTDGPFLGSRGSNQDVAEHKLAEEERVRISQRLAERVKQLVVLHMIARTLQTDQKPLSELLQQIALILPPAWQYPETTAARITFGDMEIATGIFAETPWRQRADFITSDGRRGLVEVGYLEERPKEFEGPFLREERCLIDAVRDMVSTHFDHRRAEEERARLLDAERESRHTAERQAAQIATLLESMGEAVMMLDRTGHIVMRNQVAREPTGRSDEEFQRILKNREPRIPLPDGAPLPFEEWPINRTLRGESIDDLETIVVRKDGSFDNRSGRRHFLRGTLVRLRPLLRRQDGQGSRGTGPRALHRSPDR